MNNSTETKTKKAPAPPVLGADVGGTNLRVGLLQNAELSDVRQYSTRQTELVQTIADAARELGAAAVGAGVPGTLDRARRRVLNTPNLPSLAGYELAARLEDASGLPVFLENDAVMLLTGDVHRLGLPEGGVILGVYVGTGLGSCVFSGGSPYLGANAIGVELGHIPFPGNAEKCGCGNTGCAESCVSGAYLERLVCEKYPGTPVADAFSVMSEELKLRYAENLACAIAAAVNLFDPDTVILGGGVPAMRGFPLDEVLRGVYAHALKPLPAQSLNIKTAPDDGASGVLGAALFAAGRLAAI
ncbi:MAG: ROK family protein [Oscillospiraceae bacterium]|jgi:allose kinase|nr:ROK family protein [Oscillospiraceae bacterium]